MTTSKLQGVIAAIATAVDDKGEPDCARSTALARFLLASLQSRQRAASIRRGVMKKIGIIFGMENTFPPAFVEKINSMAVLGVSAEFVKVGGVKMVHSFVVVSNFAILPESHNAIQMLSFRSATTP